MRWVGHVARWKVKGRKEAGGETERRKKVRNKMGLISNIYIYIYQIFVGNLNGTDHIRDLGVNGRIILKCVKKKLNLRVSARFRGPVAGYCEHSIEFSAPVKGGELVSSFQEGFCSMVLNKSCAASSISGVINILTTAPMSESHVQCYVGSKI